MRSVCFSNNMFLDPLVSQDEDRMMPTGRRTGYISTLGEDI